MAFGVKTNERPGTRAQVKYVRMSAYKARQVLDLVRGKDVAEAESILRFTEREAARVVRKCLLSAVANAENNDGIDPETLYVSACYADEGMTIKRWRPRARGRATRIRKRTCHITVIVSPYSPVELERQRRRDEARGASGTRRVRTASEARAARVARSRQATQGGEPTDEPAEVPEELAEEPGVTEAEAAVDEAIGSEDEPTDATDVPDEGEVADAEEDEPILADDADADEADEEQK